MKKLNQKGFTLIEVLAVIAIIAILGLVSVPGVLNSINNSKKASYNILLDNIKTAGINLFEEVDLGNSLNHYNNDGKPSDKIIINANSIEINLQTLVSNGFLKGITNENKEVNKNNLILLNPITDEDIGTCQITITKLVDSETYKTTYQITGALDTDETSCPKTIELENGV